MAARPCLTCGTLIRTGTWCSVHRARPGYDHGERIRRVKVVAAHVQAHGWVCPGFQTNPHPSFDLTADHLVSVSRGGAESGSLRVLCRSCNSRRH